MKYKVSKYNFVFPFYNGNDMSEEKIMYNSRTGALALIDDKKYSLFMKFAEEGISLFDDEFFNDLRVGGYIVEDEVDELSMIKYRLMRTRFSQSVLGLTIAPTSDCNFRCIYCYEKDKIKPTTMSAETQEFLIAFVAENIENVKKVDVTWYGGEPLLVMDIIESLSYRLMRLCEKEGVEYSASIITNGYLLTPEIVNRFVKLKIQNIQVTLDGDATDHDQRRPLVGGKATFNKIIDNLCYLKDVEDIFVALRINADKHNIDRVDNVVKAIKQYDLENRIRPYLAMVENANGTYNDNSCFRKNEFSIYEYEFTKRNQLNVLDHIPNQVANYCGADYIGSFVISAEGIIYKCWSDLGNKARSVGDLRSSVKENLTLLSYMEYDATEDAECRECKFLPLCMGGCPYMRQMEPSIRCSRIKYSLESFMSVIPVDIAGSLFAEHQSQIADSLQKEGE